jgi:hypothetical protein
VRLPERLPVRLPLILFSLLAVASVGAFYLTQHLKIQNPLINGDPRADPAVINPRFAGVCRDAAGEQRSFRATRIGFYLQSKSDTVIVQVVDPEGTPVAQMAGSGRRIAAGAGKYAFFSWNGREASGRYAPAGVYSFNVILLHEGRNFPITGQSVRVLSKRPTPRVTEITVNSTSAVGATTATGTSTATTTTTTTTTPSFTPDAQTVSVHFRTARSDIGADVLVYRSAVNGTLRLVKVFGANPRKGTAVWDGLIGGRPAPAGTYLIGLSVKDASCTTGHFPLVSDPAPGSTDGAGVNVSYLTASAPLVPVPAGTFAGVGVRSGGAPYSWALRVVGKSTVLERGTSSRTDLHVRLPDVGLYDLALVADGHRTAVPLVASGVGARANAKVLVVLPALSWQGDNATDGSGDGLIDTLADGGSIGLARPLAAGLPADVVNEAELLSFLDSQHLSYDLTTDVALAEGSGPELIARHGVILDGTFTWLPSEIANPLRGFVAAGGALFAAGLRSLQRQASITTTAGGETAGHASALSPDPFGVTHGAVSPTGEELITELTDQLGILTDVAALSATRYQVLEPAGGRVASAAGVSDAAPTVVGFHLQHGTVVEAGLPDFGSELATDVDARQLLSRVWQVVLR